MEGMDPDMEHATNSEGGSNSISPPTKVKMTILKFNGHGEPYGPGFAEASTYLRYLTRTYMSIKYKNWREADVDGKETMWKELKVKFQQIAEIMLEKGEKDTIDPGPLFKAFGVNKRGRTRCVSSVISRKVILASSFARHLLQEMSEERQDVGAQLKSLHHDNADFKQQLKELVEGLKNGAYNTHPKDPSYVSSASGGSVGSREDGTRSSNMVPTDIRLCYLFTLWRYRWL